MKRKLLSLLVMMAAAHMAAPVSAQVTDAMIADLAKQALDESAEIDIAKRNFGLT
mgnify:CR=1 FL=1